MSEVKVNKVSPRSGTTVTIGDNGDTINIVGTLQNNGSPLAGDISSVVAGTGLSGGATSGVATLNIEAAQPTITSLGTITGFTSTGIDDNATSTAITIDSSEKVGINSTTPSSDAWSSANSLVIKDTSGDNGLTIISSSTTNNGNIAFTDSSGGSFSDVGGLITYLHNGDSFRFMTANAERMRLNSTGLGIGTSSPTHELTVSKSATGISDNPTFQITNTWTGEGNNVGFSNRALTLLEAGNGTVRTRIQTRYDSGANLGEIGTETSHDFRFLTNGSERIRITSAGLVGINNTAPSTELEVYGTIKAHEKSGLAQANILIDATAVGNPHLAFQQEGTSKGFIHYLDASDTICLNDGSGNGLHYSPTLQRLGIGTSSPSVPLEVSGSAVIGGQVIATGSTTTTASRRAIMTHDGSSMKLLASGDSTHRNMIFYRDGGNDETMRITTTGRFLMNLSSNTSPAPTLEVLSFGGTSPSLTLHGGTSTSSGSILIFRNGSGSEVGGVSMSNLNAGSSVSFNTSSDYRLKENIVEITDATTRLKQLKPKRFNFIADADTTVDGFIAHEVSSVVPEAITGTKDAVYENGNIKPQQIDQSKLVPLLVKTIQELEARITTLENA